MRVIHDQLVAVAPVTVLGIGNIILRDEGFGVRAVEYLEEHFRFPHDVRLLDGGTLGPEKMSSHEIGIQDVLAWLTVTDRAIPNVVVLGMQPHEVTAGLTLSPEMAAALPRFAHRAVEELVRWGIVHAERPAQRRRSA